MSPELTILEHKLAHNQYYVYADKLLTLEEVKKHLGPCTLETVRYPKNWNRFKDLFDKFSSKCKFS
jgi:hypothetical protein